MLKSSAGPKTKASKKPAERPARGQKPVAIPTEARLHEAALAHVARFGTTRAQLARVLDRRIERWARAAGELDPDDIAAQRDQAKAAAAKVVERLAASGAVDDAAFAASRARRLVKSGRSRRAISAHLAARGVGADDADTAISNTGTDQEDPELAAAVATARRRRAGPFRTGEADDAVLKREMAGLARAGFSHDVARRALAMDTDAAEIVVERLRRG